MSHASTSHVTRQNCSITAERRDLSRKSVARAGLQRAISDYSAMLAERDLLVAAKAEKEASGVRAQVGHKLRPRSERGKKGQGLGGGRKAKATDKKGAASANGVHRITITNSQRRVAALGGAEILKQIAGTDPAGLVRILRLERFLSDVSRKCHRGIPSALQIRF